MNKLLPLEVCTEFCSLLLSKPLVLLDIPRLKNILELCGRSNRSCCSSSKDSLRIIAEKEIYDILKSLSKEDGDRLRQEFLDPELNKALNIIFKKTSKNLVI